MNKNVEKFLSKISLVVVAISTFTLLYLIFEVPTTCIPPNTSLNKPHLKFPFSSCDPSLSRPIVPLSKKNHRLWSSNAWKIQVLSHTTLFNSLWQIGLLNNQSKVLCVMAGAGHEVTALNQMGIEDVTGVDLVDSLPLVKKSDPNNLPFFDGVFDVAFTNHFAEALFPVRFAGEMERTVRVGGVCVLVLEEDDDEAINEVAMMFRSSTLVSAQQITLLGTKRTRIIVRVHDSNVSA